MAGILAEFPAFWLRKKMQRRQKMRIIRGGRRNPEMMPLPNDYVD